MFHVELRQFVYVGRAFNLTREELDARILVPWTAGAEIQVQDRRWTADKAKLTIYEGPALRPDEIGLGRGWNNATKGGENVTERLLEEAERQVLGAPAAELKEAIVAACLGSAIPLGEVAAVVAASDPQRRPSELLAAAEQAVWELLHAGRVRMLRDGESVAADQWQPLLLSWSSWTDRGPDAVAVQATAG
jgi:hypothetical protein